MSDLFRIGVLADTHMPHAARSLPSRVFELFQGVALILHAGDLDEPSAIDSLKPLAPVIAVRGNPHVRFATLSSPHLPKSVHMWVKGYYVVLTHGLLSFWQAGLYHLFKLGGMSDAGLNRWMIRDQQRAFPNADLVVFGHSHLPTVERHGRTLFINPGTPIAAETSGQPTVALITIDDTVHAEIVPLFD